MMTPPADQRTPRPLPSPCSRKAWAGTAEYVHVCTFHKQPAAYMVVDDGVLWVTFECGCTEGVEVEQ